MASTVASLDHDINMASDMTDNESQISRESCKRSIDHEDDLGETSKRVKSVHDGFQSNDVTEGTGSEIEMYYGKGSLANSLHGNIYQLKLQMLFLKRALDKNYHFQLGTEVEDAHKFDDIVFKYKSRDETGNFKIRFVQAKHRLNESEKIKGSDLLTESDDDFSLQKYFISYSKMIQGSEFSKNNIKDLIIYTNIDFDYSNLKKEYINKDNTITENDPILRVTKSSKNSKRVKLSVSKDHKLYDILRKTTDSHVLANSLKQHIIDKRPIDLKTKIFKNYQYALSKTVFNIKMARATFRAEFLDGVNLSEGMRNFRNILQSYLNIENSDQFQKTLSKTELRVSKGFSQLIELDPDPIIQDSNEFANILANIVFQAEKDQKEVITIDRRNKVINSNIDKLAFYILVQDEPDKPLVRFGEMFFDENRPLKGNLDIFRADFKNALIVKFLPFSTLKQYKFKITNFFLYEETSNEDLVYLKAELPNATIKDAEIDDFFNKLVFAVSQPNELELGEIITEEMGQSSQFNLLDAGLVSNSFQDQMLNWFKQKLPEKGKEGEWLNAESGKEFMNSIEQKVSVLISSGISLAYPDKLAAFGIRLEENKISKRINRFLSKGNLSEKILCITAPGDEVLLSAINVYSSLETLKQQQEHARYLKNDSCIFISLKTLLGKKQQPYIINSFKSKSCFHLLIVVCKCTASLKYEMTKLCRELSDVLMKTNKKIILVAKEQNEIVENFDEDLKSYITTDTDDTTFLDLTDESKKKLLQKQVEFQGRKEKVSLNELINQSDKKTKDVINMEIIVKLLKNKEISIGTKLKDLRELNECYIHRKFRPVVFSIVNIQKYLEESAPNSDLFVVTGADSGLQHNNIYEFDNTKVAEEAFHELLTKYCGSNIHWLNCVSINLIWYKSHGSIRNILPYRIQNDNFTDYTTCPYLIEESRLIHEDRYRDKMIIISGTAGMGKTSILTKLSMNLIEDTRLWIIRINLKYYTDSLKKIKSDNMFNLLGGSIDVVDFLLNKLKVIRGEQFEKDLFLYNLKGHRKIAFLFDGFDEISPNYADIIIDLLKSLRKFEVYINVTTRPNFRQKLETSLEVFSYYLAPFSKEEQVDFLVKFWTEEIKFKTEHSDKLKIYAKCIIKHLCELICDKDKEFICIPLHLKMIADVFQENNKLLTPDWQSCKEFICSDLKSPKLPEAFTLVQLYEEFVYKKYFDFYLKNKLVVYDSHVSNSEENPETGEKYTNFKLKYGLLALQIWFNEEELKHFLSAQESEKIGTLKYSPYNNEGFINETLEGKPQFIHRTFAEYFAAILIAEKILAKPSDTLQWINNVMLNMSPIFMHTIIEHLAGKHKTLEEHLGRPFLRFIVEEKCFNFLKHIIQCNYNDWHKILDAYGKTPLHYAIQYGNCRINVIETLLQYANDLYTDNILIHGSFKYPEYKDSVLVKFTNVEDKDGKTAIYYAVQQNLFDVALELLLKGACINVLIENNQDLSKVEELIRHMYSLGYDSLNEKYILYVNVLEGRERKYHHIREKLVLIAPTFFNHVIESDQSEILSYFFRHGRYKVIVTLLGTIDDLNKRKEILKIPNWSSKNSLEIILSSNELSDDSRLEITKCLFEHSDGFSLFSMEPPPMKQVIRIAALKGHVQTLRYFIDRDEKPDYFDIVYNACAYGQIRIIEHMYEYYKDLIIDANGNTGLHAACAPFIRGSAIKTVQSYGFRIDIIKFLIDQCDINAKNKNGQTPLDLAKSFSTPNVMEYLISRGAKTNSEIESGSSCLPRDPISVERFDYPSLHSAILANDFDLAKKIIRCGADVNERNNNGDAPLHLCITNYQDDILGVVSILLLYGAIFDVKDNSGRTPYDLIPDKLSESPVFWVLSTLKKLFSCQNLIQVLKDAVFETKRIVCNDKDLSRKLVENPFVGPGINILICMLNSRNNQRKTLLHLAADSNCEDVLTMLVDFYHNYNERLHSYFNEICYLPGHRYQPKTVDSPDIDENAPIHLAASKGHKSIVFRLLECGIKFNSINSKGDTPKVLATLNNHTDIVEVLQTVEHLFVALEENNTHEIEAYIKAMRTKNSKNSFINVKHQSGKSALHLAVSSNEQEQQIVKLLLDNGANVKTIDDKGNTPLHIAAKKDNYNNVKLLMDYGAIIDATNDDNDKPLKLACGYSYDLLKLVDNSFKEIKGDEPQKAVTNLDTYDKDVIAAIVHSSDHKGNTLLHYAVHIDDLMIVECLLRNGAMYDAKNMNGMCPATTDRNSVTDLLTTIKGMFQNLNNIYEGLKTVNKKVILNVLDCKRKSLLDYAKERGDLNIKSCLNDLADE